MDVSAVTISKAVSLGSKLPQIGKIQKQIIKAIDYLSAMKPSFSKACSLIEINGVV
jgi:hypothetical protein